MPLLVHLDRVDAAILALVVVLADGGLEGFVDLADAMAEDVGEAKQDRQLDAALLQLIDQLLQVDGLLGAFVGVDGDVAPFVDAEIALAPVPNLVGLDGVLDFPCSINSIKSGPRRGKERIETTELLALGEAR